MGATYRSKLSSKGQLVIPAEIRRRLRLRPGTEVTISEDKGRLVIEQRRQTFEDVFKLQGILKGEDDALLEIVEEDKRREREHLERLDRLARR